MEEENKFIVWDAVVVLAIDNETAFAPKLTEDAEPAATREVESLNSETEPIAEIDGTAKEFSIVIERAVNTFVDAL